MTSFSRYILLSLLVLTLAVPQARASVFEWQDPVSKVSLSVPDTWARVTAQKPDDVVTFSAPGVRDYATCRMRVRTDKRFNIYPARYSDEVQRLNFSTNFWDTYLAEYDNAVIHTVKSDVGLGRGFASYAEASYITTAGPKMQKRAMMFVSLYRDQVYILECSAEAHAYSDWHAPFLSVAKSVDFRKVVHEFPSGHYRNFSNDTPLSIYGQRPQDISVHW